MNWHKIAWEFLAFSHIVRWWKYSSPVSPPDSTLLTPLELKQIFFLQCVARFLFDAKNMGYLSTTGEAWRSEETCALYKKEGKGIKASLHPLRLAIDLNFYYQGRIIETPSALAVLWESYSTKEYTCRAGFFFKPQPDSDHFSIEHNGIS